MDVDNSGNAYAAGELLVTYKGEIPERPAESLDVPLEPEVEETMPEVGTVLFEFPESARTQDLQQVREELEEASAVESVEYNYLDTQFAAPNDPRFKEQWGLRKARFDDAWNRTRGRGAKIAIVDSGAATGHPDLKNRIAAQRDLRNEATPHSVKDYTGHGTHIAGIAAAATGNRKGVAGSCPRCGLMIAKVIGRDGSAKVSDVAEGIIWSTKNGADVINLSLGSTSKSETRKRAVRYATGRGVVVTAAAGNYDSRQTVYPAAYKGVLGVTATGPRDGRVPRYSRGGWVDVAAPGVDILSTVPSGYARKTGTSIASPHVAGLAGLLSSQGRGAQNIKRRIQRTAVDLGSNGRDIYYGSGRIDAYAATKR
ncbi:MAG TPA: S8 family serine peptidase [Rubrobacteraceae bacterium]|nr:S8 family serine peptidase [Rubrobacteraceae bacterium]